MSIQVFNKSDQGGYFIKSNKRTLIRDFRVVWNFFFDRLANAIFLEGSRAFLHAKQMEKNRGNFKNCVHASRSNIFSL